MSELKGQFQKDRTLLLEFFNSLTYFLQCPSLNKNQGITDHLISMVNFLASQLIFQINPAYRNDFKKLNSCFEEVLLEDELRNKIEELNKISTGILVDNKGNIP
jgi:hypothetical protein